jgi:hypothetical protein
LTEYTCPQCGQEMAIVFVGDGTAYDECQCGTASELYSVSGSAEVQVVLSIGTKQQWEALIYGADSNWPDRYWPDIIGDQ